MSRFVVDSRSLLAVRDALGRLHEQLLGVHTTIDGYWGSLGGAVLEGELEHFCGTWHYGVTEIADEVTTLMERLAEAAAAYERIEQRVASAGHGDGSAHPARPGTGSGVTVIGGGGAPTTHGAGSGVTVIGGAPIRSAGSGVTVIGGAPTRSAGSGVTVVDERSRPAEERELAEVGAQLTLRTV